MKAGYLNRLAVIHVLLAVQVIAVLADKITTKHKNKPVSTGLFYL
jgi:hypothetical protein